MAKRQGSYPSPGRAADIIRSTCAACLSPPDCSCLQRGCSGSFPSCSLCRATAVTNRDTGQWLVPNNTTGAVTEPPVQQTPAKLKMWFFHLTREQSSGIKRELEQPLLFLATGHSHFWENKRIEECCHFSVVCSYILRDNFAWMV